MPPTGTRAERRHDGQVARDAEPQRHRRRLAEGVQDQPDRQLPAADDDAGGDPVAVLERRRGGELQADPRQGDRVPGPHPERAEPRVRVRQLPPGRGRREGGEHAERAAAAEQDHQGVVRAAELRGDQGREPVRVGAAEAHEPAGAGGAVQPVRAHHQLADPARGRGVGGRGGHRYGCGRGRGRGRGGGGRVARSRLHPVRPARGGGARDSRAARLGAGRRRGPHHGQVRQQPGGGQAAAARGRLPAQAPRARGQGAARHQQGPAAVQPAGRRRAHPRGGGGGRAAGRLRLVHLRLQPGRRHRRQRPLAAVRPLRRCAERQSDPRLGHVQVQGLRLRHHDQLRGGRRRHPVAQRLRARRTSAPSQLQN